MSKPKTIVFIDGSNTYFAQKKSGFWLDWVKIKYFLEKQYQVLEYRYYVGLRPNDQKIQKFLRKLGKIGFEVIYKQVKIIVDEFGNKFEKANFDVEITADILKNLGRVDIVIVFSGDSDFAYLCQLIHEEGKKIYFFSSKKTLAWELRKASDRFFYLENYLNLTKHKSFVKL